MRLGKGSQRVLQAEGTTEEITMVPGDRSRINIGLSKATEGLSQDPNTGRDVLSVEPVASLAVDRSAFVAKVRRLEHKPETVGGQVAGSKMGGG